MYDVGAITRALQSDFGLFAVQTPPGVNLQPPQNKATPEGLRVLLDALGKLTDDTLAQRNDVGISDLLVATAGGNKSDFERAFDSDMLKWRGRLGAYNDAVDAAPAGDRQAVLWSVTAPLLFGFFGGESSDLPQQPLDAATPFTLANMLATNEASKQRAWDLFLEDIATNAKKVVAGAKGIGIAVGALAAAIVVASLIK